MSFASADSLDQRVQILRRLTRRNRVVAVLRIAVPALGIAAFAALAAEITIANMLNRYGVSGIRIDRGKLVVETPQYSGTGTDGTRFVLTAAEAAAGADTPNLVDLTGADLTYTTPGQPAMFVHADNATFDSDAQKALVPDVAMLRSNDGLHGTLRNVTADLNSQLTVAEGPVDLTFGDGSHLVAANMRRDSQTSTFDKATLVVPSLPQSGLPPVPDFAFHGWVGG